MPDILAAEVARDRERLARLEAALKDVENLVPAPPMSRQELLSGISSLVFIPIGGLIGEAGWLAYHCAALVEVRGFAAELRLRIKLAKLEAGDFDET